MATPAVRNNNPGNLRDPNTGAFRQFATQEEGYAALLNDLEAKRTGNTRTGLGPQSSLSQFAGKYAPAEDNNDPVRYSQNLASQLGTTPDAPISQVDIGKLAMAVAHNEDPSAPGIQGNAPEFISDEQYAQMQGGAPEFISDQEYAQMQGQSVVPGPQYQTQPQLPQAPETPPEPQEETWGSKLRGRLMDASESLTDAAQGKMAAPFISAPLQVAGAAAGAVGDTVGSALSAITPDFIEKPVKGLVGNLISKAADTNTGKAIGQGVAQFSQAHPELSKDIGSVIDIASVVPVGKAVGVAKEAGMGVVAKSLQGGAEKAMADSMKEVVSSTISGRNLLKNTAAKDPVKTLVENRFLPGVEDGKYVTQEAYDGLRNALDIDEDELQNVLQTASPTVGRQFDIGPRPTGYVSLSQLRNEALDDMRREFANSAQVGKAQSEVNRIFDDYMMSKGQNVSLQDLNEMKRGIREAVNFASPKLDTDVTYHLGQLFMRKIEEVAKAQGLPQVRDINARMASKITAQQILKHIDGKRVKSSTLRKFLDRGATFGGAALGEKVGQATGIPFAGALGGGVLSHLLAGTFEKKGPGGLVNRMILDRTGPK